MYDTSGDYADATAQRALRKVAEQAEQIEELQRRVAELEKLVWPLYGVRTDA